MKARYYQIDAVNAAWAALKEGKDPVIELPTGSGKSYVVADLCDKILKNSGRVLVLSHVAEIISQNAAEFQKLSGIEPGILCAGLERTDKGHDVLFASVQSLYGPAKKGEIEPFNLLIVDECHLCADKDSDAKFYPTAFSCFPTARRLGLSATPFRQDGPVYGEGKYFSEKVYSVSTLELVREGFLSPLVGVSTSVQLNLDKLKTVAGDYDQKTVEEQQTDKWLRAVAESVKAKTHDRKHIAVFCPTVKVAHDTAKIFTELGMKAGVVVGDTENRDDVLESWKAGDFPVLCSVNILSTGFNFPAMDCLVCIRPTQSLGLWIQLLGRLVRNSPSTGKKNGLVLDFSGNLEIHGGICAGMEDSYKEKKDGKFEVSDAKPNPKKAPGRKIKTGKELTDLDPMLASPKGVEIDVSHATYVVLSSRTHVKKKLLMVTYSGRTIPGGIPMTASQFVMPEYEGYAYQETVKWFARRGEATVPYSAEAARIKCYSLPVPRRVWIRKSGKYLNVVGESFE